MLVLVAVESAKAYGIEPFVYLRECPSHEEMDSFMPWDPYIQQHYKMTYNKKAAESAIKLLIAEDNPRLLLSVNFGGWNRAIFFDSVPVGSAMQWFKNGGYFGILLE